jgi:hypothetical protein
VNGRWVALCIVAIALVVAFVTTLLPRVGPKELIRHQVTLFLEEHLPAPVSWDRVEVSLDPPRIEIFDVSAGRVRNERPLLEAEQVIIEVELDSLRRGIARPRAGTLRGLFLRLDPEADSLRDLFGAGSSSAEAKQVSPAASESAAPKEPPAAIGQDATEAQPNLRWSLLDGEVVVVLAGPEGTEAPLLLDLRAQFEPDPDTGAGLFEAHARAGSGGSLALRGQIGASDRGDASLEIAGLEVRPLAEWGDVGGVSKGLATGLISVFFDAGRPERVHVDVEIRAAKMTIENVDLEGRLGLRATLWWQAGGARRGTFEIDAGNAKLDVEGAYAKPVGRPATLRGSFRMDPSGRFGLEDFELSVGPRLVRSP